MPAARNIAARTSTQSLQLAIGRFVMTRIQQAPSIINDKRSRTRGSQFVIAVPGLDPGIVPAISIRGAQCPNYRDGRDKPGHDQIGTATTFAPRVINVPQPPACDRRRGAMRLGMPPTYQANSLFRRMNSLF